MLIFDQLKKNDPQLRTITWSVLIGLAVLLAMITYLDRVWIGGVACWLFIDPHEPVFAAQKAQPLA